MRSITTEPASSSAGPAQTYVLPATIQVHVYVGDYDRDQSTAGALQGGGKMPELEAVGLLAALLYVVGTNTTVRIEHAETDKLVIGYERRITPEKHRLTADHLSYITAPPQDHHWFLYEFTALPTGDPDFNPLFKLWLIAVSFALAHHPLNICSQPVFKQVQETLAAQRRDST